MSASAISPSAIRASREPASPAARRGRRGGAGRSTFCTPRARQSLKLALQPLGDADVAGRPASPHRRTEITFGAARPSRSAARLRSSDDRLQPGGGAGHQDPQRRGVPDRGEVEDDERRVEVETRRWSGRRTCRAGRPRRDAAGPSADGAVCLGEVLRGSPPRRPATIASRGWSSASTTIGSVGSAVPDSSLTASSATRSPASSSGSARAAAPPGATERRRLSWPSRPPRGLSGLSRTSPPGRERDRPRRRAPRASGAYSPFESSTQRLAAEDALAVDVGLDQGRLARGRSRRAPACSARQVSARTAPTGHRARRRRRRRGRCRRRARRGRPRRGRGRRPGSGRSCRVAGALARPPRLTAAPGRAAG